MEVSGTSGQVAGTSGTTKSKGVAGPGGDLGKDQFLKLLLAQLKNQDPLKPMDDSQFIAQLAQFSALERMQELDNHMARLLEVEQFGQAYGLIGKEVEARTGKSGETAKGIVESVKMVDGSAVLSVGGKSVKLTDVSSVVERESSQLAQASNLIKMEVEARIAETGETVRGIVDEVKMENGSVVLKIGGRTVRLRDVIAVAEGERART